jgi:hypothetical protein
MRLLRITVFVAVWGILSQQTMAQAPTKPPTTTLMVLSALELLYDELQQNPDLTLDPIIQEAAGTVFFPRHAARDTLATLIGQLLAAGEEGETARMRAEIEAAVAEKAGMKKETLSLFTTELLVALQTALEEEGEDLFLDEILGEATDAANLDENRGQGLALSLTYGAARKLRLIPPRQMKSLPQGIFVLAVNLQSSSKTEFQGYEFRGSEWSKQTLKSGTSYMMENIGKSMTLRRRFRRIVPCYNLTDYNSLLADYLLVVDISEQNWKQVQDPRDDQGDPEEILSKRNRPKTYQKQRDENKVMEVTLEFVSKLQVLPGGEEVWTHKKSLKRYNDELMGRTTETENIETREGWKIDKNTVLFGILDLVTSQTRIELSKLQ